MVYTDQSGKITRGHVSETPVLTKTEIALSPATFQRYVGTYELMHSFNLVITLENGRLLSQATNQHKAELFGMSEARFFLKAEDIEVEFVPNAGGACDLVVYQGGQKAAGKRK